MFQIWLEDCKIDIICCGHTHEPGVKVLCQTSDEIRQFTCGSILGSDETCSSFYIYSCENHNFDKINIALYTFGKRDGKWEKDSRQLRMFKNGTYEYYVPRNIRDMKKIIEYSGENKENISFNIQKIIEGRNISTLLKLDVACRWIITILQIKTRRGHNAHGI